MCLSMTEPWNAWEHSFERSIGVDALVWQSLVLVLICFHLRNEVDEVLWLFK